MALKRTPLRRRAKPRKQPNELERMAAFKLAALYQGSCAVCGSRAMLVAHHVVTQQHVRRADGDVWDPRNAIPLCSGPKGCHEAHHNRSAPIPYSAVPPDAWDFANQLLSHDGAVAYFDRYYQTRPTR